MLIPAPEPGLVISYAYLWNHEAQCGQEEGRKDRPRVIAIAVQRQQEGETLVTVLPITHQAPQDARAAVELPPTIKRHVRLDDARAWIVISEGDQFICPAMICGRQLGGDRYEYGFLPPNFFTSVLAAFRAWHKAHKVTPTPR